MVGPRGRRIVAEDCGELQVGALGVEPRGAKRLRVGVCFLPIGDKQMMESVRRDDEAHTANVVNEIAVRFGDARQVVFFEYQPNTGMLRTFIS